MDKKDSIQIIVLRNGVEQVNVTNPRAAVINVVEHLPAEKQNKSNLVVYGAPQHVFFAQRDLEKNVQKNVLKGILRNLEFEDEADECDCDDDGDEAADRAEAAAARLG